MKFGFFLLAVAALTSASTFAQGFVTKPGFICTSADQDSPVRQIEIDHVYEAGSHLRYDYARITLDYAVGSQTKSRELGPKIIGTFKDGSETDVYISFANDKLLLTTKDGQKADGRLYLKTECETASNGTVACSVRPSLSWTNMACEAKKDGSILPKEVLSR